jgi:quercetin dioxygenase-like cupin family protein
MRNGDSVGIIAKQDWSQAEVPAIWEAQSANFQTLALLGPHVGTVHTDLGVSRLGSGGRLNPHVHSYEEAIYLLEGELALQIADAAYRLVPGDFAFFPIGTVHAMTNPGRSEARWMYVNSPVALRSESGRTDTFFPVDAANDLGKATVPNFADPTLRLVGHYGGTSPDHVSEAVKGSAQGRASAGMDTGVIAYSGISVKMLVDQTRGANLLTLFMVDYAVNGAAQVHDHPFEEAYFFLEGDTAFELGGEQYQFGPGDVAWAAVGETHACFNTDGGPVRWLETQAPVPPRQHSYRWPADWDRYQEENC